MNFTEVLFNLTEGKSTKEMNEIDNRALKNREVGIQAGIFNFTREDLESRSIPLSSGKMKTEVIKDFYSPDSEILNRCTYYKDLKSSSKVPYINGSNVGWYPIGFSNEFTYSTMSSHIFKPIRMTTYINVSKMLLQQTKDSDLENELKRSILRAFDEKLVETILSNNAPEYMEDETTLKSPSGIIYEFNKYNNYTDFPTVGLITSKNDYDLIHNMMTSLDTEKKTRHNVWIISPKAKEWLIDMFNDVHLFQDNKFYGQEVIFEPLLEDGYILNIDLSKLVISQFGNYSIVVNPISDIMNGNVQFIFDGYFDFAYLDYNYMSVGRVGTENSTSTTS